MLFYFLDNQIGFTDVLVRPTTFTYDRLGRMITKNLPGTEGVVNYIFDELTGTTNGLERLVALDDPVQRKDFNYDKPGHRIYEKKPLKTPHARNSTLNYGRALIPRKPWSKPKNY